MKHVVIIFLACTFFLSFFGGIGVRAAPLTLDGLGFEKTEILGDPKEYEALKERTRKLQLHQKLGLATLALVAATAAVAKEGEPAPESHEVLGVTTGLFYFTTAYFSLTAPEPKVEGSKGWNMKIHRAMAFIHFPAMALLPFAGSQASRAYKDNKDPGGLGKYHKDLANVALAALSVSALSVVFDF
jgi:cytochrome b561